MLNARTTRTAKYFFRAYPRRTAALVVLLILSGIAEGIGLITLLPLLEVGGVDPTVQSDLARSVTSVLAAIGISPTFTVLMALIVAGLLAKAAFLWLAARQVGYTVAQVAADLRLSLIRSLMAARWSYFASQPAGHLANAIGAEALRASQTYRSAVAVLSTAIQAMIYFCAALLVSWWVAVVGMVSGGVMLLLFSRWVGMSRDAGDRQTDLTRSLVARLIDALRGIKPIKAMAREHYLWPLLESETHGLNEANRRQVLAGETLRLFQEPLMVVIIAGGLWTLLQVAELNLPTLTVMAFLFYRLTGRFQLLQTEYASMVVGESAFIALRDSVDRAIEEREPVAIGTHRTPHLEHAVELRNVTFGYTDEPVVRDVSLLIPAGEFVSIVGASGAGKTTILDLLIGLHEPWSGGILVDGVPLAELDRQAWRKRIGYVPQETFLFHDTIARNVTLGDESISRERVENALRMAGAWSFVNTLPEGIDSHIGEAGGKLSGGQRQRIALARALVAEPDLLILDEATSALDPETERAICETLGQLRGATTIVSISHQPAMVIAADRIYRLAEGRISDTEIRARARTVAS